MLVAAWRAPSPTRLARSPAQSERQLVQHERSKKHKDRARELAKNVELSLLLDESLVALENGPAHAPPLLTIRADVALTPSAAARVFSWLPARALLRCSAVNRSWSRQLHHSNDFWRCASPLLLSLPTRVVPCAHSEVAQ